MSCTVTLPPTQAILPACMVVYATRTSAGVTMGSVEGSVRGVSEADDLLRMQSGCDF